MMTNDCGQFTFTGFLGDYELTLGLDRTTFSLTDAGEASFKVVL